ncbi:hypothetical protein OIU77_023169 [Salix suchowensis]|uniref:Uncharacterized protein n=1 Tax=Salix suchowensis TaxID=1278906 RepID=A0ABQ9C6J5_9ROSI|nr:hypothetical protein OIU77_023169 [Salix suchowensis]
MIAGISFLSVGKMNLPILCSSEVQTSTFRTEIMFPSNYSLPNKAAGITNGNYGTGSKMTVLSMLSSLHHVNFN